MAHAISRSGRPTSFLDGARRLLGNLAEALARHRTFERVHGELANLSDRELADIGLHRSQIVRVAWDASER